MRMRGLRKLPDGRDWLRWKLGLVLVGGVMLSSVQFSHSVVSNTLCPQDCSTPGLPVHHQLPEFTQTHVHWVGDAIHLILCCPLLLPPSVFPSVRVFSNESVLHIRWLKYRSFSFSISPSNEYSGLISFRMDWLDLLAVQGTLKSLLKHHSSKVQNSSAFSFFYSPTPTSIHDSLEKPYLWSDGPLLAK